MNSDYLAPGAGFFGATDFDCIRIPVEQPLQGVRLSVEQDPAASMNLKEIRFLLKGKPVLLQEGEYELDQSSVYNNLGPKLLLQGKGMHTNREALPYWLIKFGKPLRFDEIRIFNRGNHWARRSNNLCVELLGADSSQWSKVYGASAAQWAERAVRAALAALGQPWEPAAWPLEGEPARTARAALLAQLVRHIRQPSCALGALDWPAVIALVDFWWSKEAPSSDEAALIAAYLLVQKQKYAKTSLSLFSHLLNTRALLDQVAREMNEIAAVHALGKYVITRHGISKAILHEQSALYLKSLQSVLATLGGLNYQAFACYGTLLGAVRSEQFIAHDDDVDIACLFSATSLAGVEAERLALKACLEELGYQVKLVPKYLNLHVKRKGGRNIDVFPCWHEHGQIQLHMEKMKVRGIAAPLIFPLGQATLYGQAVPAPADPAGFLRERYGESWHVSDPYYEWPWKLLG